MKKNIIDIQRHRDLLSDNNFKNMSHTSLFSDLSPQAYVAISHYTENCLEEICTLLNLNSYNSTFTNIRYLNTNKHEIPFKEDTLTLLAACLMLKKHCPELQFYLGTRYPLHEQIILGCTSELPAETQLDLVIKEWSLQPTKSIIQFSNQLHLQQAGFSLEISSFESEITINEKNLLI